MSIQASSSFDLAGFCRAVEGGDVDTQMAMYAPDATVTIADRITQPGHLACSADRRRSVGG
jgi:ketosteroid isomerase-like protein